MKLGTMVIVLRHDPVPVAEEVALLDTVYEGRVVLGLGLGLGTTYGRGDGDSETVTARPAS